jgi:hypothetical protein
MSVHPPQHSSAAVAVQGPPQVTTTTPSSGQVTTTTVVNAPPTSLVTSPQQLSIHESLRRYFVDGTSKFFGVNGEDSNEKVWIERRRRVAIKLFGGVKDDFHIDGHHGPSSSYDDSIFNEGNGGSRLRYDPFSSEMVEGKMVLKIQKPPRNKDSLSSLTGQSLAWVFNVIVALSFILSTSGL